MLLGIADATRLPRPVAPTLGRSIVIKIHGLCYPILRASEQFKQSILISSRAKLCKSNGHKIKFPNKLGTKGVKHQRTICAK